MSKNFFVSRHALRRYRARAGIKPEKDAEAPPEVSVGEVLGRR
jgi:hypothetical protein